MATFENKEFSDQHERLSLSSKIDQQLDALKNKSDGILEQAEQKISQDALKDTIAELERQEKNPDELLEHEDPISGVGKKQLSSGAIPPHIVQKINDVSENPASRQGRENAYRSVDDFSQQLIQQGGIFGKIVSWLS